MNAMFFPKSELDETPMFRYLAAETGRAVLKHQHCGRYLLAPEQRWFCIHTHPGQELLAVADLHRQGFLAYLPLFVDRKRTVMQVRYSRRPDPVLKPLFPAYMFIPFDRSQQRWSPIALTRGVKRIFGSRPDAPTPVPVGVVEALIARSGPDGYIDDAKPADGLPEIEVGASIRINEGPMTSFEGVCEMSDGDRVRVLLNLFGRSVPVTLDRSAVEVV